MLNAKAKKEIEALVKKHGGTVTPKQVVDFARSEKTALHAMFTWDDTEAAEKWRLHQARNVLRIVVQVLPSDNKPYRAMVSLTPDRKAGNGYRQTITVLSDEQMAEQMLKDALAELNAFRAKYSRIKALSGVFAEIDKLNKPKRAAM